MVDKPFIISQPIQPVSPAKPQKPAGQQKSPGTSFNEVLKKEIATEGLKFSRHAQERLEARRIQLEEEHLLRLKEAVEKADTKGAKESLVLLDDLAFVVSIKNRTVITAVDGESRKGNVFTNIDSAIIN
ncbi:MAG TPA: TIGR02530 family flagellar biosynthesis protein [Peptococcaceae bacterium]|jgi:flagellar operon protein|nr:flagellar protein [Clostridia bacterium]HOB81314.1 TIGR02530 family flagellar biosynthesis protein [Peptococcaceae bacterium]HPZ70589.1 TIGR02530 family flagellar biosynthesis protein [Peptococcaceae bacterium]HQD53400.1 TIGR02530 family flagellar biosynthesis protein [Peptococcaceae bacterium]